MASNVLFAQSPAARSSFKRDLLGALFAGQLGGLIMVVALCAVFSLFLGTAWYHPVQVIGAVAWGDEALPGGFFFPAFISGLLIHQAIAAAWSVAFGNLMNKVQRTFSNVLTLGLATAALSQVLDTSLLAPAIMNRFHGHNIWSENVPLGWSWIVHGVFGLGFLAYLPVRQWLRRNSRAYSRMETEGARS